MKTIDPQDISTGAFYSYMVEAVAPRPIAFASTMDREGRVNLSPYSFFNAVSSNPPVLVFSPVNRTRDGTPKDSLLNVQEHAEVVINIVNYTVVEQMSLASAGYERGTNEFAKAGLTEVPSVRVKPPRVAECPVAFECRVQQIVPLGDGGGAGHLVICEILLAHVHEAVLNEEERIDPHKLDAVGRMGGNLYCRASGDALFEISKPGREAGMGIDQLPPDIRESEVLTGNDLARLASLPAIPSEDDRHAYLRRVSTQQLYGTFAESVNPRHAAAQSRLQQREPEQAWAILLAQDE